MIANNATEMAKKITQKTNQYFNKYIIKTYNQLTIKTKIK
jgi:hypothetical protein